MTRKNDGQPFPTDSSSSSVGLDSFFPVAHQDEARQAAMAVSDNRDISRLPSFRKPEAESLRGDTLNSYLEAAKTATLFEQADAGQTKASGGPRRVAIITACGNKKECQAMPAYRLYKSSRIKAVYGRRQGHDMLILSAKHGLLPAEKVTEPYNQVMSKERADELLQSVVEGLKGYDTVIYFKAGARKDYVDLMNEAARRAGVKLVTFGSGNMAGIGDLPKLISDATTRP